MAGREEALTMPTSTWRPYGRYNVARLIAAHGADAKLTELLVTLANCEKALVQHPRPMQSKVRGL
jgi:hypothetical protein